VTAMLRRRGLENAFSLFAFQDIITSVTGVMTLVTLMLAVELVKRRPSPKDPGAIESAVAQAQLDLAAVDNEVAALQSLTELNKSFIDEVASLPPSEIARSEAELTGLVNELDEALRELRATETVVQGRLASNVARVGGLSEASLKQLEAESDKLLEQLETIRSSNRIVYNPNPRSHKSAWLIDFQKDRIQVTKPGQAQPPITFQAEGDPRRVSELLAWARLKDKTSEYFVLLVRPESVTIYQNAYDELNELGFDLGFDLLGSDAQVTAQIPASRSEK
jgi:hypothetical protein